MWLGNSHEARETERFVENHKIIFQLNPHFPVNTIALMRGAIFALGKPWEQSYRDTMFHAMWVDQEKMDDPVTALRVMEKAGLPAEEILSATQDPAIKAALIQATSQAVARGVFGAPTLIAGIIALNPRHGPFIVQRRAKCQAAPYLTRA